MKVSPVARRWTAGRFHSRPAAGALWNRLWRGRPPHWGLVSVAAAAGSLMAVPLVYLLLRSIQGGTTVWANLAARTIPGLLVNSLGLAAAVTGLALCISLPLAWLVVRSDLPGRRWFSWLAAVPLVFPPYVGAFAYITVFGPRGSLEKLVSRWTGIPGPELQLPAIYSFWGTAIVLALFTYPYVYFLAAAALRGFNQSLEDAARSAGLSPLAVFRRVTLPLLKPAAGAGALLVALYALADFGAVTMMRYDTFTSAIYLQLRGRLDRSGAAILSTVLVLLTLVLLWAEGKLSSRGRFYQTTGTWRPGRPVALGAWRWPALAFMGLVLLAAVGMPGGMLVAWAADGLQEGLDPALWRYTANSLGAAAAAATLGTVLAFPLAYLATRYRGALARVPLRLAYTGYALPGVVVALACIFLFNTYLPAVYGTVWVLLAAYCIRFLPQAAGAQGATLAQISPNLEDAGRSLGHPALAVLRRVTLPLAMPGLLTGWSLMFLNSLKELPATLLLRPAGYDTLAVRVWIDASEGFYALAAGPALALVLLAAPPLAVLLRRILAGQAQIT